MLLPLVICAMGLLTILFAFWKFGARQLRINPFSRGGMVIVAGGGGVGGVGPPRPPLGGAGATRQSSCVLFRHFFRMPHLPHESRRQHEAVNLVVALFWICRDVNKIHPMLWVDGPDGIAACFVEKLWI